jgi:hypothetical protein
VYQKFSPTPIGIISQQKLVGVGVGVGEPDGRRLVSEKLDWRLIAAGCQYHQGEKELSMQLHVRIDCPTAAGDSSATTPAIACVVRIVIE